MCKRTSSGTDRFEINQECSRVQIIQCNFVECSSQGNGGSVLVRKYVPVNLKSINVYKSTALGSGGGFCIQSGDVIGNRICFYENSAYGDYPNYQNNHFHAVIFHGLSNVVVSGISNVACILSPHNQIDGDTTFGMDAHQYQVNDINISHSYPRAEMFLLNNCYCPYTNSRINLGDCKSGDAFDFGTSAEPVFSQVNIINNNETNTQRYLIYDKQVFKMNRVVIANNNYAKFLYANKLILEDCIECMNSFSTKDITECYPSIGFKTALKLNCQSTIHFSYSVDSIKKHPFILALNIYTIM